MKFAKNSTVATAEPTCDVGDALACKVFSVWFFGIPRIGQLGPNSRSEQIGIFPTEAEARRAMNKVKQPGKLYLLRGDKFIPDPSRLVCEMRSVG